MAKPEFHIFVCIQRRADGHPRGSCAAKGGEALFNAFAAAGLPLLELRTEKASLEDVFLELTGGEG